MRTLVTLAYLTAIKHGILTEEAKNQNPALKTASNHAVKHFIENNESALWPFSQTT